MGDVVHLWQHPPAGATPARRHQPFQPSSVDLAATHRHLFCAKYDACLDYVAAQAWSGWSCRGCAVFEAHLAELERKRKEVLGGAQENPRPVAPARREAPKGKLYQGAGTWRGVTAEDRRHRRRHKPSSG